MDSPQENPEARRQGTLSPADTLGRRLVLLITGLGILSFFSVLAPFHRRPESPSPRRRASWFPVAKGQVCFLEKWEPFKIARNWEKPGRFRVKDRDAAFESSDLETALRIFVRERLAGVRLDEPVRIQLLETFAPAYREAPLREPGVGRLDWSFALREVKRGQESWYFAATVAPPCSGPPAEKTSGNETTSPGGGKFPGESGEALSARSTEDLKEKLAREIARELGLSLPSL